MAEEKERKQVRIKMDRVAVKILALIAQEKVAFGEVGDLLEMVQVKLATMPIAGRTRGPAKRGVGARGRRKTATAS